MGVDHVLSYSAALSVSDSHGCRGGAIFNLPAGCLKHVTIPHPTAQCDIADAVGTRGTQLAGVRPGMGTST